MLFQSVQETQYRGSRPGLMVFTVPHGADASSFLAAFPELESHPDVQSIWPLFLTYLSIERDLGSSDLAHAIAHHFTRRTDIPSLVFDVKYPRGLLDGGRKLDHCMRDCLPRPLMKVLSPYFLRFHEECLHKIQALYQHLATFEKAYILDVHTMASYCPVDAHGRRQTFPVSFQLLPSYVDQYLDAPSHDYQRKIDLITADDTGKEIADPQLKYQIEEALSRSAYPWSSNEPYRASSAYLSHQHMCEAKALSIDVPKHLLTPLDSDVRSFQLDQMRLDPLRIDQLAICLAGALSLLWSP